MNKNTAKTTTEIKKKIDKTTKKNIKTNAKNTALEKLSSEIIEYGKNPDIGVDFENLQGYIHNHKWAIKPNAHIASIRNTIRDLYVELIELPNQIKSSLDVYKLQAQTDELVQQILEIGLVNFDYTKEADHIDLGPVALKLLAQEIAAFLVVRGGRVAATHSKMLQKLAMLEHLKD